MAYETVSVRITVEEFEQVQQLMKQGITQVSIFRRGLAEIGKELNASGERS